MKFIIGKYLAWLCIIDIIAIGAIISGVLLTKFAVFIWGLI